MRLASWEDYPFKRMGTEGWPGRELWWLWQHPATSTVILVDSIITALLFWGAFG